jgi:hypothetical protein
MTFEIAQAEYLQPKRISTAFNESISGLITNKTRYRVFRFTAETNVLSVSMDLQNFTTSAGGTASTIQLVARAVGNGSDGIWKALTSEIPSGVGPSGWTASTNLNAKFPDSNSELVPTSTLRGADAGFGLTSPIASGGSGTVTGGTVATQLQIPVLALPFLVGSDVVEVGFDIGGGGVGQITYVAGRLSVITFDRDGGITPQASLGLKNASGISLPFATLNKTNGCLDIAPLTGQTAVGTARTTI